MFLKKEESSEHEIGLINVYQGEKEGLQNETIPKVSLAKYVRVEARKILVGKTSSIL